MPDWVDVVSGGEDDGAAKITQRTHGGEGPKNLKRVESTTNGLKRLASNCVFLEFFFGPT